MYDKVSTNLNFVDREKKTEKFWEDNQIFEKVLITVRDVRPTHSMTDRLPQMANLTSATF